MCGNLFADAGAKKMDCPIRLTAKCHPRAHVEVFVDARNRTIILCCSKCDRPIATVKVRNGNGKKKS